METEVSNVKPLKGASRFSREQRKSMILDSAAGLIAEQGTSDLSLETIGEKAAERQMDRSRQGPSSL